MVSYNKLRQLQAKDYFSGVELTLNLMRQEREPYVVMVGEKEFVVHPNVFSPKYCNDTEIFALNLPVKPGEDFLEIGTGTGIVSIFAAYKGARNVVATDINADAILNAEENIRRHGFKGKIRTQLGDLFKAISDNAVFDTIFWNTPFGYTERENQDDLERAVHDPFYHLTEKFIHDARLHLRKGGRILIGFSSTLGRLELLKQFVRDTEMNMREVFATLPTEDAPVRFEIFEIS